jgi:hypothetical protein
MGKRKSKVWKLETKNKKTPKKTSKQKNETQNKCKKSQRLKQNTRTKNLKTQKHESLSEWKKKPWSLLLNPLLLGEAQGAQDIHWALPRHFESLIPCWDEILEKF